MRLTALITLIALAGCSKYPSDEDILQARSDSSFQISEGRLIGLDDSIFEVYDFVPNDIREIPSGGNKKFQIYGDKTIRLKVQGPIAYHYLYRKAQNVNEGNGSGPGGTERVIGLLGLSLAQVEINSWKEGKELTFKDSFIVEKCGWKWAHIDRRCGDKPLLRYPTSDMIRDYDNWLEAANKAKALQQQKAEQDRERYAAESARREIEEQEKKVLDAKILEEEQLRRQSELLLHQEAERRKSEERAADLADAKRLERYRVCLRARANLEEIVTSRTLRGNDLQTVRDRVNDSCEGAEPPILPHYKKMADDLQNKLRKDLSSF